jgi:hypothetical protein
MILELLLRITRKSFNTTGWSGTGKVPPGTHRDALPGVRLWAPSQRYDGADSEQLEIETSPELADNRQSPIVFHLDLPETGALGCWGLNP